MSKLNKHRLQKLAGLLSEAQIWEHDYKDSDIFPETTSLSREDDPYKEINEQAREFQSLTQEERIEALLNLIEHGDIDKAGKVLWFWIKTKRISLPIFITIIHGIVGNL